MPANHEIHGYMPMRKEFEHETDNDAEAIIKDIEFTDEDSEQDRGECMTLCLTSIFISFPGINPSPFSFSFATYFIIILDI